MRVLSVFVLFLVSAQLFSYEPIAHFPTVVPSYRGAYYAKLLPESEYPGYRGRIEIYEIGYEKDEKLLVYDWYSPRIYFAKTCNGFSVVRLGTELHGKAANREDMALEIYLNKKLIKRYTTLEIARNPENIWGGGAIYSVFWQHRFEPSFSIGTYNQSCPKEEYFSLETSDGTELSVDLNTGKIYKWKDGVKIPF